MAEKKQSRRGFYIILVLVLLLINGLLFYSTFQNKKLNDKLETQRAEAQTEISRLNKEIDDYILTLDSYKTDNEDLNALRDSLKQVIFQKQKEIQKQINAKNFSTKKLEETQALLSQARKEIDELVAEKERYVNKMDSINEAYIVLKMEYDTLSGQYDDEIRRTGQLRSERDSIAGLGAILQATNLEGSGVREKKNGTEEQMKRAKKTEKIKVCFNLLKNRLIEEGSESLYLKIIGPQGTTLALESRGSGIFLNRDNGEESMYTNRYQLDITDKAEQKYCVYWSQPTEYTSGTYSAEIYHKGYLIAENTFELK